MDREELMTPAEIEYVWELILPRISPKLLLQVRSLQDPCDDERIRKRLAWLEPESAEFAEISLLMQEVTHEYLKQREERRAEGLPPLVAGDLDAIMEKPDESERAQ